MYSLWQLGVISIPSVLPICQSFGSFDSPPKWPDEPHTVPLARKISLSVEYYTTCNPLFSVTFLSPLHLPLKHPQNKSAVHCFMPVVHQGPETENVIIALRGWDGYEPCSASASWISMPYGINWQRTCNLPVSRYPHQHESQRTQATCRSHRKKILSMALAYFITHHIRKPEANAAPVAHAQTSASFA
jgi:hypothetical protein